MEERLAKLQKDHDRVDFVLPFLGAVIHGDANVGNAIHDRMRPPGSLLDLDSFSLGPLSGTWS